MNFLILLLLVFGCADQVKLQQTAELFCECRNCIAIAQYYSDSAMIICNDGSSIIVRENTYIGECK